MIQKAKQTRCLKSLSAFLPAFWSLPAGRSWRRRRWRYTGSDRRGIWREAATASKCKMIPLRTIPRAPIPFVDFYIHVGFAEHLCKAKAAEASSNNELLHLRHKRPFSSQEKGRTGDRTLLGSDACANALASPGLPTGPWLSHVRLNEYISRAVLQNATCRSQAGLCAVRCKL